MQTIASYPFCVFTKALAVLLALVVILWRQKAAVTQTQTLCYHIMTCVARDIIALVTTVSRIGWKEDLLIPASHRLYHPISLTGCQGFLLYWCTSMN